MNPTITAPSKRPRLPLLVYGAGVLLLWTTLITSEFTAPSGVKRGSPFDVFEGPLIILSAAICALSPTFTQRRLRDRILLIIPVGLSWLGVLVVSGLLSIIVFGLPQD